MQSVLSLFRLGLDGILLNPLAYRNQRDSPNGLRRGFILVVMIGLIVGIATLIGDLGEYVAQPRTAAITKTIYDGLRAMPWYAQVNTINPQFPVQFDQIFAQVTQIVQMVSGGGIIGSLVGVITTPLIMVVSWLFFGTAGHLMARTLGGRATFNQTLACTALASGVNLLSIVQVVPFAQVSGTLLLGLVTSYVAIRVAHELPPWRTFWATMLGPVILALILIALACVMLVLALGALGSALPGGSL